MILHNLSKTEALNADRPESNLQHEFQQQSIIVGLDSQQAIKKSEQRQLKIPIKINKGKFPLDFFQKSRTTQLKLLLPGTCPYFDEQHEKQQNTPKFVTKEQQNINNLLNNSNKKQLLLKKQNKTNNYKNPSTSRNPTRIPQRWQQIETDYATYRQGTNNFKHKSSLSNYETIGGSVYQKNRVLKKGYLNNEDEFKFKNRHENDGRMVQCLNDIIGMTEQIKNVYKKHSLQLKKETTNMVNSKIVKEAGFLNENNKYMKDNNGKYRQNILIKNYYSEGLVLPKLQKIKKRVH